MDRIADARRCWRESKLSTFLSDSEATPLPLVDPDVPAEERRKELEWLRVYQRELEFRLRAIELDADVIGRPKTRAAHE